MTGLPVGLLKEKTNANTLKFKARAMKGDSCDKTASSTPSLSTKGTSYN